MACNLLSFQGLQAERRDSIPLRSTIKAKSSSMGGFAFNMRVLGVRTPVGSDPGV